MPNFRMTLSYDGTRYNGWQRQGNTPDTIQGRLEAGRGTARPGCTRSSGRCSACGWRFWSSASRCPRPA